jgi:hypothetical protein
MVKFGKFLHTVLAVRMVQIHYPVSLIFFLAVISTYGTIFFYRVLSSLLYHRLIDFVSSVVHYI